MKRLFLTTAFAISMLFLLSSAAVYADINTGNANATTIIDNIINTNDFDCDCDKTPTPTPTETPPTPTPTSPPSGGGGDGGGGGGSTNPPVCPNEKPRGGPYNLQVKYGPAGQATLTWEPAQGPVDGYNIAYSEDPSVKKYGVPNVGNVTSYTVSGLSGTNYYWWVTPLNGCMPGDPIQLSEEPIKAVLGLSTTSSGGNGLLSFAQLFISFALSATAFSFFKKNAN